ncbi:MAG: AAA family ATPase [Clostridiales bacterium]|nr:AAA family ATPase [Clostridiales bacterium]
MRYYAFSINTNKEKIEKNAKIALRDYSYDEPIAALNSFMFKKSENDITFFIYKEEGSMSLAAFAFDEQKVSYQHAYEHICDLLDMNFCARPIHGDPYEVTMYHFMELLDEARRRGFLQGLWSRISDTTHLWLNYHSIEDIKSLPFELEERIVPEKAPSLSIYDEAFREELSNIRKHKLPSKEPVNLVHYILSGNSRKVEYQLAETLVSHLFRANRLTTRRVVYISEIHPVHFTKEHFFEKLIENNYGGTIVIDMSVLFGFAPADYTNVSKYLEKLFKTYFSHCLFIFTYNKADPGYSYYLLQEIGKIVTVLPFKEGKGDRKAAAKYLKTLIEGSEYAAYAGYMDEFMETLKGGSFTQTQIVEALERFGPWSMNKSLNGAYDYDSSERFMLERDAEEISAQDKLDHLIGLSIVKKQIERVIASDIVEKARKKEQGDEYQSISTHMIFSGNPGTAKTTVAKIFAGIAKERDVLRSGVFVERGGMDLDGLCCVSAIREAFVAARGGVLFIDEAYAMRSSVAIATLIQEMENQRENVIVILAGYHERMQDFLEHNEGLRSRIPHWIDFPDYSTEELTQIFTLMISDLKLHVTEEAVKAASLLFDRMRLIENFGNGRYVRNLVGRAMFNQSARLLATYGSVDRVPKEELFLIKKEDISSLQEGQLEAREPGQARSELDALIGLASAKEVINKAISKFKLDKLCMDRGMKRNRGSMHMVFTGNPGTAKTTVARLCSEILNDEKILSTGSFVEVGRADLVGDHVGETAILVKKKFREAAGGVLFIDEAYSLCDHIEGSFGDEAINTIVQEMENHREDVVVIFAGYPKPMKDFVDRNPGMKSRIAFFVEFADYSTDELCEITKLMVEKKQMTITEEALRKLRGFYDVARKTTDYGNGRFVRKLLEEAEMNLANRVIRIPEEKLTEQILSTLEECDIPDYKPEEKARFKMGFAG